MMIHRNVSILASWGLQLVYNPRGRYLSTLRNGPSVSSLLTSIRGDGKLLSVFNDLHELWVLSQRMHQRF
jgi:hypothetical protein